MARHATRTSAKVAGAIAAVGCLSAGALLLGATASASAGGDNNKGDVWLDNVGQPPGPGHEHDPHLACANINLWGDKLADSGGRYTIDGWSPSGSKEQVYAHHWSYDRSTGGVQVLDVIKVNKLVAAAQAAGDQPVNKQGLHFKLQFVQDPQKHKTFWVNCTSTPPTPTPTPTPTS